jgi:hypothetical protein
MKVNTFMGVNITMRRILFLLVIFSFSCKMDKDSDSRSSIFDKSHVAISADELIKYSFYTFIQFTMNKPIVGVQRSCPGVILWQFIKSR